MTVAASPLGMLQLCGSALANKLAEICAVQGYNDPFKHSMYYGELHYQNSAGFYHMCDTGILDPQQISRAPLWIPQDFFFLI
jgi:hypothetical protein